MCVLRAYGQTFDPDAFLRSSSLEVDHRWRRGAPKRIRKHGHHETSGLAISLSDDSLAELSIQVEEVERYLSEHRAELQRLAACPGLDAFFLDFGAQLRIGSEAVTQSEYYPPSLVRLAGSIGVGLNITIYPCSDGVTRSG